MANQMLHYFWLITTAFFVFAAVYSWFVAIIVRRALPGEMVWVNTGLAFITGTNAFIRSGQQVMSDEHLVILERAMWIQVAISMIVAVIVMGAQYNGAVSSRIPLSQQWRMLHRGLRSQDKDKGANNET